LNLMDTYYFFSKYILVRTRKIDATSAPLYLITLFHLALFNYMKTVTVLCAVDFTITPCNLQAY
jgi:hypothetical protein